LHQFIALLLCNKTFACIKIEQWHYVPTLSDYLQPIDFIEFKNTKQHNNPRFLQGLRIAPTLMQ